MNRQSERSVGSRTYRVDARTSGFTLAELLGVFVVIAVLTALIIGGAGYATRKSDITLCKRQMAVIAAALEEYHADHGTYPPSQHVQTSNDIDSANHCMMDPMLSRYLGDLKSQWISAGWKTQPLRQGWDTSNSMSIVTNNVRLFDPWNKDYTYRFPGVSNGTNMYDLSSPGVGGQSINNWSTR